MCIGSNGIWFPGVPQLTNETRQTLTSSQIVGAAGHALITPSSSPVENKFGVRCLTRLMAVLPGPINIRRGVVMTRRAALTRGHSACFQQSRQSQCQSRLFVVEFGNCNSGMSKHDSLLQCLGLASCPELAAILTDR